jgi:hypothetical protein
MGSETFGGSRTRLTPWFRERPYPILIAENGAGYYDGCLTVVRGWLG